MQFMQRAKQQMTVLRALDEADGPLSARELWSRLSGTGVGLATVYRALQRGVEEGTLESVEGLAAAFGTSPRTASITITFFARPATARSTSSVASRASEFLVPDRFQMTRHEVVLFGTCDACGNAE